MPLVGYHCRFVSKQIDKVDQRATNTLSVVVAIALYDAARWTLSELHMLMYLRYFQHLIYQSGLQAPSRIPRISPVDEIMPGLIATRYSSYGLPNKRRRNEVDKACV